MQLEKTININQYQIFQISSKLSLNIDLKLQCTIMSGQPLDFKYTGNI